MIGRTKLLCTRMGLVAIMDIVELLLESVFGSVIIIHCTDHFNLFRFRFANWLFKFRNVSAPLGRHLRCTNQVAELTAVRVAVEIAVDEGSVTQEGSSPNAKNIIFFFNYLQVFAIWKYLRILVMSRDVWTIGAINGNWTGGLLRCLVPLRIKNSFNNFVKWQM